MSRLPKRTIILCYILGCLIVSPAVVFGAGGGDGHHAGPSALLYPAINFSLYFGLMWFLLAKRIAKFATSRVDEIHALAERGTSLLSAANGELKTVRDLMASATKDSTQLALSISEDGKVEIAKVLDDAKRKAERIVAQGRALAASEERAASESLRTELSQLVLGRAKELCRTKLSPAIDQQLIAQQIVGTTTANINFGN